MFAHLTPAPLHQRQRAHTLQERDRASAQHWIRTGFTEAHNDSRISAMHPWRGDVVTFTGRPIYVAGDLAVTIRWEIEHRTDSPYYGQVSIRATIDGGAPFDLLRAEDYGREDEQPIILVWPSDSWLGAEVPRFLGGGAWSYPGVAWDTPVIDHSDLEAADWLADGESDEGSVN